jgi:hypothetical protein
MENWTIGKMASIVKGCKAWQPPTGQFPMFLSAVILLNFWKKKAVNTHHVSD